MELPGLSRLLAQNDAQLGIQFVDPTGFGVRKGISVGYVGFDIRKGYPIEEAAIPRKYVASLSSTFLILQPIGQ